jgi:hypothetical protein
VTTWDEFEQNLARTIRESRHRTYVVISVDDTKSTAQFCVDADRNGDMEVVAEIPIPGGLPGAEALRDALRGWGFDARPAVGSELWSLHQPWPAPSRVLTTMAHAMRYALSDGFGVPSPDELVYRAWRYPQQWPRNTTLSDEQIAALDRGDEFLEIPELGVRRDPTHRPEHLTANTGGAGDPASG